MRWPKRLLKRQTEPENEVEIPTPKTERDLAYDEALSHEEVKQTYARTREQLRRIALLEAEVELLARQGGRR